MPTSKEVQSRGRNASSRRPFTQCQGRVPKAEGPEENRDEVLYPAMERRETVRSRRNVRGCRVVEDADQNIDRDQKPGPAEKEPYIRRNSPICGPPRGKTKRHLNSSPLWPIERVRIRDGLVSSRERQHDCRAHGPMITASIYPV